MSQTLGKWGHSLAYRVPKPYADQLNWNETTEVEAHVVDGKLIIEAVDHLDMPVYALEDLLADMRPETFHSETDWGPPVGKEVW
jgi:antitoxin MazE